MSYTVRKLGDFDYKTRLLGILPYKFVHIHSGPWQTRYLRVCKKPSQYNDGQLDLAGHPTLIGSGVVERRFGLENALVDLTTGETDDTTDDSESETESPISSTQVDNEVCVPDDDSVEEEKLELPATRFVANCFNPLKDSHPDFICERLAMIHLAIEDTSYILKARKHHFTSKIDSQNKERKTIELRFLDLPCVLGNRKEKFGGPQFVKWATKDDSPISSSKKHLDITADNAASIPSGPSDEAEEQDDDFSSSLPYHYAFIQGELIKNLTSTQTRKFTVHMSALIGGVWNLEDNPENYTCEHLAEMRTANENTIRPMPHRNPLRNAFYKKVRMQRNWFQAHLTGEKMYMVGINGINSEKNRIIKELWLYDVEKIPRAITIAAEDEGFHPWTPDKLHHRLFSALEFIHDTMKNAEPDEEFIFIHCDDGDYLYYDNDGSLMKAFIDAKSKLVIRGLPRPPPGLELKEQKIFDEKQLVTVLKCVGYFRGESLPCITRIQHDLELTFNNSSLAKAFLSLVKGFWCRKENIPSGFEKLWIESKSLNEPLNFNGACVSLNPPRQSRFTYDNRPSHGSSYTGRSSFDSQKQFNNSFGRNHPHSRNRTSSGSENNWRK